MRSEADKPAQSEWESIAEASDADELRERIFTGFKAGKPFTPYVPTIELPAPLGSVLDFGCGVGRNFPYLKSIAHEVVGFDLEPMIARCRVLATETVDALTSDWGEGHAPAVRSSLRVAGASAYRDGRLPGVSRRLRKDRARDLHLDAASE